VMLIRLNVSVSGTGIVILALTILASVEGDMPFLSRNQKRLIIIMMMMMMMMMIPQIIRRRNMSMKSLYKGAVHPIHAMNAEQCQTAADPWTKPTELSQLSPPHLVCS